MASDEGRDVRALGREYGQEFDAKFTFAEAAVKADPYKLVTHVRPA